MKLERFRMAEPGDCRVVFSAAAEELEAAVRPKGGPGRPAGRGRPADGGGQPGDLEGFSPLFAQLMKETICSPSPTPDFELLGAQPGRGLPGGAQFFCLPPLELGEYTGFTQPVRPRPIRELTIELEMNRRHGDEDRAADTEGERRPPRQGSTRGHSPALPHRAVADGLVARLGCTRHRPAAQAAGGRQLSCRAAPVRSADAGRRRQFRPST